MILNFTLNNVKKKIEVNSTEPLSYTLSSLLNTTDYYYSCKEKDCGECLVYDRHKMKILLSCITPAFELSQSDIITPEYFFLSEQALNIKEAYETTGYFPCPDCLKKRTLLFYYITRKIIKQEKDISTLSDELFNRKKNVNIDIMFQNKIYTKITNSEELIKKYLDFITSSINILKCGCLYQGIQKEIIKEVLKKELNTYV